MALSIRPTVTVGAGMTDIQFGRALWDDLVRQVAACACNRDDAGALLLTATPARSRTQAAGSSACNTAKAVSAIFGARACSFLRGEISSVPRGSVRGVSTIEIH